MSTSRRYSAVRLLPTTSAEAVSFNVTAVSPSSPGHLVLYPNANAAPPPTSILNFVHGQVRANNAISALASGGQGTVVVRPMMVGEGTVHVVLDVTGYFQ